MGRLTINPATGMLEFAGSGGSGGSGITIGTTTITGGVSGRVLYDAAGVVGEMTTTGSGTVLVLQTSPSLITPLLGTPTSGTLTNCTGLPLAGLTGLGTGVATALSVNVGSAGAFVVFNGALGTPSSGTLTSCTGLPLAGLTGLGTGVATALAVNVGSAGAFVTFNGALGTPSSGTLTNATGLPVSSGISGLGTGVATFLATPSSANLAAALTDETGTGLAVFDTSPTLITPAFTTTATLTRNSVGVTSADGVVLTNGTAAAVNAQQYSPRLRLTGQGWKTTATAASQTVDVLLELQPVQWTTTPISQLVVSTQINAGGYNIAAAMGILRDGPSGAYGNAAGQAGIVFGAGIGSGGQGFIANASNQGLYLGRGDSFPSMFVGYATAYVIQAPSNGAFTFSSANSGTDFRGNTDTMISRKAAASVQLGFDVNGAAVAQAFGSCAGITGTDRTGAPLTVFAGPGTGAGAVSSIAFQTPTVGVSGTTAQSLATRLTLSSAGAVFTGSLTTLGGATFHTTSSALTDGAAAQIGTLTNGPTAGNPTKWIGINDNGTTRYIPAW